MRRPAQEVDALASGKNSGMGGDKGVEKGVSSERRVENSSVGKASGFESGQMERMSEIIGGMAGGIDMSEEEDDMIVADYAGYTSLLSTSGFADLLMDGLRSTESTEGDKPRSGSGVSSRAQNAQKSQNGARTGVKSVVGVRGGGLGSEARDVEGQEEEEEEKAGMVQGDKWEKGGGGAASIIRILGLARRSDEAEQLLIQLEGEILPGGEPLPTSLYNAASK